MEEEFVSNQERLKPQEERNEEERTKVCSNSSKIAAANLLLHLTGVSLLGPSCHFDTSMRLLSLHAPRWMNCGDPQ